MRITTHAGVRAALSSPHLEVPPVAPADDTGGMRWLRATVSRFSTGHAHRRRRWLATAALADIDAATLGRRAGTRVGEILAGAADRRFDLMSRIALPVPAQLLARALGMAGDVTGAVLAAAPAYHPRSEITPVADDAVAALVRAAGGVADERTAARIGLLMQAAEATAGLVAHAVLALRRHPSAASTAAVLAETLRYDPPVRLTRRCTTAPVRCGDLDLAAGTELEVDLAAANRDGAVFDHPGRFDPGRVGADRHVTFGAGQRSCPGAAHARTLAGGIVDVLRTRRLEVDTVRYGAAANLRVPASLMVRIR